MAALEQCLATSTSIALTGTLCRLQFPPDRICRSKMHALHGPASQGLQSRKPLPSAVRSSRCCNHAPVKRARRSLCVVAHGHGAGAATELKKSGFVGEMRAVAMKLHTREQAPKEGQQEAPKPAMPWQPTREGYARYLAESRAVYEAFEDIMKSASHPEYKLFQNTGLERTAALTRDLEWFKKTYGIIVPPLKEDGPGLTYVRHLRQLAADDPPAFICHYYNYYFAHTAGGRMIGQKVASMILDGHTLDFYKWDGDVAVLLDAVRANINKLAEGWTREQKDHCLQETLDTFKCSGGLMQVITQPAEQ